MNKGSQSPKNNSLVHQGTGALKALEAYLKNEGYQGSSIFIITDDNCRKYCLPLLQRETSLVESSRILTVGGTEEDKSIEKCIDLWRELTQYCVDRNAVVINLGGGLIGDLGGFVAATFKRGIEYINVPTTLLAQVDAALGGKTAVNFMGHKNLVGVFKHPKAVFVDPRFLETLSKRELLSGMAEVVKHALIADGHYWKQVLKTDIGQVQEVGRLVKRSIEIKNEVVESDPLEKGRRKVLNFGHTIGHAIESCSLEEGRPLLHGEAIAIGIVCESYLSYKFAGLDHALLDEICSYMLTTFPVYEIESHCFHRLVQLMQNDKKNTGRQINFSLITGIGEVIFDQALEIDAIVQSLQFYNEKIALMQQ